jgi:uncharacterized protein DUF3604
MNLHRNGKEPDMTQFTVLAPACALLLGFESQALAQSNPLRDAYFGETHLHTSWSGDAWLLGDRLTTPADAYKYMKGQPIKSPAGFDIKIDTPLDFAGVTDHSEYVGVVALANDPNSPISKLPAVQPLILKNNTPAEASRVFVAAQTIISGPPVKALMTPQISETVWQKTVAMAEEANQPGKFTAFCSYEWTSMPNNMNLHRNIFFKDCAHIPAYPFSSLESTDPSIYGRGWTPSARQAMSSSLSPITRIFPTGACIPPRSIFTDDRSIGRTRKRACATNR